jgi:hypothetical protein
MSAKPNSGKTKINFDCSVGAGTFSLYLTWDGVLWTGYAVLPDQSIREVGVKPKVDNWSRYTDYSIMFFPSSDISSIGYSDLATTSIYILDKQG